jgi:hypothetical protein
MKRLLVLLFLIPLFFGCSKDDKETVYIDTSKTVLEYRIDKIKVIELGQHWNGEYVSLNIYSERNEGIYSIVFPQLRDFQEEDVFAIASDSKLRIHFKSNYGSGIEFLTEAKPWENLVAPTIFKIVVERNESVSDRLKVELWGTVITVSK